MRPCVTAIIRRLLATVSAVVLCLSTSTLSALAAPPAVNMDLSSTTANVSASGAGKFSSAQINIGGIVQTVNPSSVLTPAEFVALQQVLSSGAQSIGIG